MNPNSVMRRAACCCLPYSPPVLGSTLASYVIIAVYQILLPCMNIAPMFTCAYMLIQMLLPSSSVDNVPDKLR